jgi:hypothetical protein
MDHAVGGKLAKALENLLHEIIKVICRSMKLRTL